MSLSCLARDRRLEVTLVDDLAHPRFFWPVSHISVPFEFPDGDGFSRERLVLMAEGSTASEPVVHQLTDVIESDGLVASGTLHVLSDLPSGASRRWTLAESVDPPLEQERRVRLEQVGDTIVVDNGLLRLTVRASGDSVFDLGVGERRLAKARLIGDVAVAGTLDVLEAGDVVVTIAQTIGFSSGARYRITYRIVLDHDQVDIDESYSPDGVDIAADDSNTPELEIEWSGLDVTHRFAPNRPEKTHGSDAVSWEHVDAELGPDGALPMKLTPFHNWLRWWRLPTATFWSAVDPIAIGLLVGDISRWNDRAYALWGSADLLCVRYSYRDGVLRWRYPLRAGTRSTAIACFDSAELHAGVHPSDHVADLLRWRSWLPLNTVCHWNISSREQGGLSANT